MRPWSYSRLSTYETCPKQYQYSYVEKLAGFRPPSPAADRGSALHEKADQYLKGEIKLYPPEFQRVSAHLMGLKARKAESERKLAVKEDWTPCDYLSPEAYFRAIIDVVYMDDKVCYIEDHKSGQMYDSHAIQLSDYVAVVSANYPADEYRTRLIYIDQGVVTKPKVTVSDRVKPIRLMLDGRIKNAETDNIFPTKAGQQCKWCDYSARYGGPCSF